MVDEQRLGGIVKINLNIIFLRNNLNLSIKLLSLLAFLRF